MSKQNARDLLEGSLTESQTEAAERHLGGCTDCVHIVERLMRDAGGASSDSSADTTANWLTETQPPSLPLLALPGSFRGSERFKIIRQLGQGGMGVVYEALDRDTDSLVALKTLRRLDGHSLYLFKREFRELADVKHQNLLRLGELHCVEDQWFFTMELVRGKSFIEYVRNHASASHGPTIPSHDPPYGGSDGPDCHAAAAGAAFAGVESPAAVFDEGRLRAALAQLVQGVIALHRSGHIHRDIKPSNILVTDEGRVVLLDFGLIQRFGHEQASHATERGIVGTPDYMAPEQAAEASIGPAADWYAVGVLLFEALTGTLPFSGPALEVLLGKQTREPLPTSQLVGDVPPDLDALTQALLRCAPAERPSGDEIIERLGHARPAALPIQLAAAAAQRGEGLRQLIGRDRELAQLGSALSRCEAGEPMALLVHGEPGIGKSTLVEHFLDGTRAANSALVVLRGRCYEQESVPFNAFDGVVDTLSHYLKQLDDVAAATLLPPNIQLLAGIFPVLRRLPVVARMSPARRVVDNPEQLRRQVFRTFKQLFDSLASRVPLIVYLDDLQWADRDSLELIEALLAPSDAPPLLLLATMRSAPGGKEPVSLLPEGLAKWFVELPLARLSPVDSEHLLARLLEERGLKATPEASSLSHEASGHPLFLQELVRHATAGVIDADVRLDDLIMSRVAVLDETARRLLEILAIAGVPIKTEVVASTADIPLPECVRRLRSLRSVGLVRVDGFGSERRVQTFHDRVREAIMGRIRSGRDARYSSVSLQTVHLRIGRQLLRSRDADAIDSGIFSIAHHLNVAQALLGDIDERRQAAELNLRAARKAMLSTAYRSALGYLRHAAALLANIDGWRSSYPLTLAVHREWMACTHLAGDVEEAGALYRELIDRSTTSSEKAEVMLSWIELATGIGRFEEAIATCRAALRLLGHSLPSRSGNTAVLIEHAQLRWHLRGRRPEDLQALPENEDDDIRIVSELLHAVAPACFFFDLPLMSVCLTRIALLTVKHGLTRVSAYGFCGYGVVLAGAFGRYEEANAFSEVALRLNERFGEERLAAKLLFIHGTYQMPWVRPFAEARQQIERAREAGGRLGDRAYEAYAAGTHSLISYCEAVPLHRLQEYGESASALCSRSREYDMGGIGAAVARYAAALRASTDAVPTLALPGSTDAEFFASLDPARMPIALLYYYFFNAELAFSFGDCDRASRLLHEANARITFAFSIPTTAAYHLLEALVAARLHDGASWAARRRCEKRLSRSLKRLEKWSRHCPANFAAARDLARGESARIAERFDAALGYYQSAACEAREHGHLKHEALAHELAAQLLAERDAEESRRYVAFAIAVYRRWGAGAKVVQLQRGSAESCGSGGV